MKQIALLTTIGYERKGVLARPGVLNKLAPYFYTPRWQSSVMLKEVGLEGEHIVIPMGFNNWHQLAPSTKERLADRIELLCSRHEIDVLGVSRQLEPTEGPFNGWPKSLNSDNAPISSQANNKNVPLLARKGDCFITVMARLRVEIFLNRVAARRIIVAGDGPDAMYLAYYLNDRIKLPVILQSREPGSHESAAARLLYKEGIALSLAMFAPGKWNKNDIVVLFDEYYVYWGSLYGNGYKLDFGCSSSGHIPLLEQRLAEQGIDPALHNLAPLLEAHLLADADGDKRELMSAVEQKGAELWKYLLDKEFCCHYNTLKDFDY